MIITVSVVEWEKGEGSLGIGRSKVDYGGVLGEKSDGVSSNC